MDIKGINQGFHEEIQGENVENDRIPLENFDDTHCFETTDSHIKIEIDNAESHLDYDQNMDTGLQNINQQVKVEVQKFENGTSGFDNTDYTHCCGSNHDIDNLHTNMDTGVVNIKQEREVKIERRANVRSYFENNDNVYIFENIDSTLKNEHNVTDDMLVDVINIKKEIKDPEDPISEFDFKLEHNNCDLHFVKSENAHFNIENTHVNIESVESADLNIEKSSPGKEAVGLKSKITVSREIIDSGKITNPKEITYAKEITDSREITNSRDITDSRTDPLDSVVENNMLMVRHFKDTKSTTERNDLTINSDMSISETNNSNKNGIIMRRLNFKLEHKNCDLKPDIAHFNIGNGDLNIEHPDLNIENADFNIENPDLNIEKSAPGKEARSFKTETTDSRTGPLDSVAEINMLMLGNDIQSERNILSYLHQRHGLKAAEKSPLKMSGELAKQGEINLDVHQCKVCDKKYNDLDNLRTHTITHRFKTIRPRIQHTCMVTHKIDRPHQCNVCDKRFKALHTLRQHMITHNTDRPHQCNLCDKRFKRLGYLRQHMITHSTDRPHQCNVCDKIFKTLVKLKEHMVSHSTDRPHQCNLCDKGFKGMRSLRQHMISHSTARPHQCNLCDKGFKQLSQLRRHMISHSTDRPHQCSVCDKGFKRLANLRNHMISHGIERSPHQCKTMIIDSGPQITSNNM